MLDATIEAVVVPASKTVGNHVPHQDGKVPSGQHLHARFLVPSQWVLDGMFDEVHYCFAGVLRTRIGSMANTETLICLTDTESLGSFQPYASGSGDRVSRHYLDINLHIPASQTLPGVAEVTDLPPSMSFADSTYLTQQTALSDRHRVEGICEVCYRIQAQFCRGHEVLRDLSMPIKLLSAQRIVLKTPPLSDIAASPKFNIKNIWKSSPTISIDLFDAQPVPMRHDLNTHHKSISMPFTVRLRHIDSATDLRHSLRCTLEAQWCWRRSFATTKLNNMNSSSHQIANVFRSTHQTRVVYLPPFWPTEAPDDIDQAHAYAATTDIVLFVPDCMAEPTIRCGLLSRTYTLELSFCIEGGHSMPHYTISRTIPVKVQVHNPGTETLLESLLSTVDDFNLIESDAGPPPSYGDQTRSRAVSADF